MKRLFKAFIKSLFGLFLTSIIAAFGYGVILGLIKLAEMYSPSIAGIVFIASAVVVYMAIMTYLFYKEDN